jgi:hypothetical protein
MSMPDPGRRAAWAVLLGATLVVGWPLLLPVLYDTHDGHYALYNAAQMDRALRDGHVPVRWLPDLFGGRGIPHFVYYHALPSYALVAIHAVGPGWIASLKLFYLATLLLSGLAMRAWLRELLPPGAALAGAVAYLIAPFRVVEIHVKGDPPAALAFVFLPLVLLAVRRAARGAPGATAVLAAASAGLVLSHSVTALMAIPAILAYAALEWRPPRLAAAARLAAGGMLGACVSAFQWLPALAEKHLVHIDSELGILFFDFRDHFVAWWQWLTPLWGYHGSFPGTPDDMSFQPGPVHLAALAVGVVSAFALEPGRLRRILVWAAAVAAASLALMLEPSRWVWELLGPARYLQFPWRLLAMLALASAVALGVAVDRRPKGILAAAAIVPAGLALVFAAVERNAFYLAIGLYYAVGGGALLLVARRYASRGGGAALLLAGWMAAVAVPWSAVPLHSAWKGEPEVLALTDADLEPERVRLGIRRTAARDDYLPRTVARIPPRDPSQEYLPPPGARPPLDVEPPAEGIRVAGVRRTTTRFAFEAEVEEAGAVTLNLHDFPGWRARIRAPGAGGWEPLPHRHDDKGRIVLDLPAGRHEIEARFGRTPARKWGDGLGLLGLVLLAGTAAPATLRAWRRRRGGGS